MGGAGIRRPKALANAGFGKFSGWPELDYHPAPQRRIFKVFQGLDPSIIAKRGDVEVADLVQNTAIIRHIGKIEATLGNVRAWQRLQARAWFSDLLFLGGGGWMRCAKQLAIS